MDNRTNVLLERMTTTIRMPKLSTKSNRVKVVKWHKNIGDDINVGDLIAVLKSKQVVVNFVSTVSGVLMKQGVKNDEYLKVDEVFVIIRKL